MDLMYPDDDRDHVKRRVDALGRLMDAYSQAAGEQRLVQVGIGERSYWFEPARYDPARNSRPLVMHSSGGETAAFSIDSGCALFGDHYHPLGNFVRFSLDELIDAQISMHEP